MVHGGAGCLFVLAHECLTAPDHLLKKSILPSLNCFWTLVKTHLDTFIGVYFWVFFSVPLICAYPSVNITLS